MKYKFKLLMAALAIMLTNNIVAQIIPANVPKNGLVGWWPFNGNANDESGNGNNGIIHGATLTSDRFGNNNKSYIFDGISNRISFNLNSINNSFPASSESTTSVWIKTTDLNGPLVSMQGNNGIEFDFHIGTLADIVKKPGHFGILVRDNCCGTGNNAFASNCVDDKWHMLTIVRLNNGALRFYKDGILEFTSNSGQNGSLTFNVSYMNFGAHYQWVVGSQNGCKSCNSRDEQHFAGKLDDIGIWNRALTQQEITDLFNGCTGTNIVAQPQDVSLNTPDSALFAVSTTTGSTTLWQTNPLNIGWQNVPKNNHNYKDTTNILIVKNTTISNHNQAFRVIVNNAGCVDTSDIVKIMIQDTCIEKVFDTILTSVSDTLKFNINLSSVPPPSNQNLIKVYPNPTNSQIIIDNGNFTSMNNYIIKIEDAISRQVFFSKVTQQQFTVDISTMGGKGLYFLSVLDPLGKVLEVKKIVLE